MENEKPIFVQCPDCYCQFNVVFNGEEVVRCPGRDCLQYLFMSIQTQKKALGGLYTEGPPPIVDITEDEVEDLGNGAVSDIPLGQAVAPPDMKEWNVLNKG